MKIVATVTGYEAAKYSKADIKAWLREQLCRDGLRPLTKGEANRFEWDTKYKKPVKIKLTLTYELFKAKER